MLPSLGELVSLSAGLDDDQFDAFSRICRGLAQPAVPWDAVKQVAATVTADPGAAFRLLEAASSLYEHARTLGDDWQARLAAFLEEFPREPSHDAARIIQRLTAICQPIPERETGRQRHWLQHGIIANAAAFSSFVDLRPSFSPQKDRVVELVPVVIVRITPDEGAPIVFQLTEASVSELKAMVDEIERKLTTLRTHGTLAGMLMPRGGSDAD